MHTGTTVGGPRSNDTPASRVSFLPLTFPSCLPCLPLSWQLSRGCCGPSCRAINSVPCRLVPMMSGSQTAGTVAVAVAAAAATVLTCRETLPQTPSSHPTPSYPLITHPTPTWTSGGLQPMLIVYAVVGRCPGYHETVADRKVLWKHKINIMHYDFQFSVFYAAW